MIHPAPYGGPIWRVADLSHALADGTHPALPQWATDAYAELRAKVLDDTFPCTFATAAQRKGDVLYAFLEPRDADDERQLMHAALVAFTDLVRGLEPVAASLRPFAVLLPRPAGLARVEDYFAHGWALLRWLHAYDTLPWPARVPRDPDHPHWSFCFGGVPLFVTFKTPAHFRRRSRRLGSAYLVLFQAREGFDELAGDTPRGRRTRALIRRKLAAYDGIPIPTALGYYGTPENREWRQYFAPEGDRPLAARCPFHRGTPTDAEGSERRHADDEA